MLRLIDLAINLCEAKDLVSQTVAMHHKQVTYIAVNIGKQIGMSCEQLTRLFIASSLHDCGALSLEEKLAIQDFNYRHIHRHAFCGYRLLSEFPIFHEIAQIIKYHHVRWDEHEAFERDASETIPESAYILHLADRIAVMAKKHEHILSQALDIRNSISDLAGSMFEDRLVKAFLDVSRNEAFWLDFTRYPDKSHDLFDFDEEIIVSREDLLHMAKLFCRIIDFRSPFTATHSTGLAFLSSTIASLMGMPENKTVDIMIAGYLHDIGKLAVSKEILEKHGDLNPDERYIIKSHNFYTYRNLEKIENLNEINTWASFHHERLDGNGYPFHVDSETLSLGSRIMAVADIFTAITEDRPYRPGMEKDRALAILKNMAKNEAIDKTIVQIVEKKFDFINNIRECEQNKAKERHREFFETPLQIELTRI